MARQFIEKSGTEQQGVPPTLTDYAQACADFSWEAAAAALDGLPDGGLNIAHEAVDRHLRAGRGEQAALVCLSQAGQSEIITYRRLCELTNRFANLLDGLGVGPGERVATLLGRVPDLYTATLGALKQGCLVCPLYAAFGPEPLRLRLNLAQVKLLVTTESLYRRKIEPQLDALPHLEHILISDTLVESDKPGLCASLPRLMQQATADFRIRPSDPETPALLHFTSGTTGMPKGAVHVHQAVLSHLVSGRLALDIHPGDRFWCTADPGWVTGTSYGIVAPLTLGASLVVDDAPFDAARWYGILQEQQVSIWYTSPTAIRLLMRYGVQLPRQYDSSSLRLLASVGEPLNPEAVEWGLEAFGLPIHDNWWQTETGGILIANFRSMGIKPGSMGRPLPGIEAAIVQRRADGSVQRVTSPDEVGELAIRTGWPSMFRSYLGEPDRYARCFAGEWYLSGDLARRDEDGYFWFFGRKDDLIKSSGHLIGPTEVEAVLTGHPAVAEAGVIGKRDAVAGEIVKAFIVLRPGWQVDETLSREILAHARRRLGAVVAPKELEFRDSLPHTRSGKIMRRLLRAEEGGLPPGDLSTLEP